MASFAVKNDLKTFGIIYNQENSYSVSLLDPFIEQLAADGITVDDSLVVAYGAADTDYKTLLQPRLYRREWTRSTARTIPSSWWPS